MAAPPTTVPARQPKYPPKSARTLYSDEQIARVTTWVDDGADLNQIQDRLKNEMEIRLTFIEPEAARPPQALN